MTPYERILGATGIRSAPIGAGCWAIGGPAENLGLPMGWSTSNNHSSQLALETAYEQGIRVFDTADVYGLGASERHIGKLVASVDRSTLVLSSKVGYFSGTAAHGYHPMNLRHQLEQTLNNLRTDYLDIYFLHNNNFGENDQYLAGAIDWMNQLRQQGIVRHVGMRGPHRYALDRLSEKPLEPKVQRFHHLAELIRPEILAVRDNLLSPVPRLGSVYDWARDHDCGVLINKPLAQGLLTGKYRGVRAFDAGDHRLRKAWFRDPQLSTIMAGVADLKTLVGNDYMQLLNVAIWTCLERFDGAIVLCGFTDEKQVVDNFSAAAQGPPAQDLMEAAAELMRQTQARLDALGEVFIDERLPST